MNKTNIIIGTILIFIIICITINTDIMITKIEKQGGIRNIIITLGKECKKIVNEINEEDRIQES